jgi:hypothetical protein
VSTVDEDFGDNPYDIPEKVAICEAEPPSIFSKKVHALEHRVDPILIPIGENLSEVIVASNTDKLRKLTVNLGNIKGKVGVTLSDLNGEVFAKAILTDDLRSVSDRKLVADITAKSTPRMMKLRVQRAKNSTTVIESVLIE